MPAPRALKGPPDFVLRLALPTLLLPPAEVLLIHISRLVPEGRWNRIPTSLLHDREHLVNLIQNNLLLIFLPLMFSL